jgi:hypothetical protein
VVALSKSDLRQHMAESTQLLDALLRDARVLRGPSPERLIESLRVNDENLAA